MSTAKNAVRITRAHIPVLAAFLTLALAVPVLADEPGTRVAASTGIRETTAQIMARQAVAPKPGPRPEHELEYPDRSALPQNPNALETAAYPPLPETAGAVRQGLIHTAANSFDCK